MDDVTTWYGAEMVFKTYVLLFSDEFICFQFKVFALHCVCLMFTQRILEAGLFEIKYVLDI